MHYKILGILSLMLGAIGAVLPLLPTTCFILLAAWCFAKSSPKWHEYLRQHKQFGSLIRDWEAHHYIPQKAVYIAIISMLITGTVSFILLNNLLTKACLIIGISIGIYTVYSLREPKAA